MGDVELVERAFEDTAVVSARLRHDEVGPFIVRALGHVLEAVGEGGVTGPPFCRIDMEGEEFVLEAGFPVADRVSSRGPVVPSSLPGGTVATVLHRGPYEDIAPAYADLQQWLVEHRLEATGAPWESYLDGPEVARPRTLVCWPCRRLDG